MSLREDRPDAARGPQDRCPSGGNLTDSTKHRASSPLSVIGARIPQAPVSVSCPARANPPIGTRAMVGLPASAVLHVEDNRVESLPRQSLSDGRLIHGDPSAESMPASSQTNGEHTAPTKNDVSLDVGSAHAR